jgi:PAS domain S-box-containing protein
MESIHAMPIGSFRRTIQDMMRTVHPEDRDMVSDKIRRAIDTGDRYEVEYRILALDGQVNWIEAKGRVVYDDDTGKPLRMIGVGTNITRRKLYEVALRDSEERFRTLAKHAPVGIFQLDSQGSCVFVNEYWSARTGIAPEQSIGDAWLSAVHPDDRGCVQGVLSKAIAGRQGYRVGFRVQMPEGKLCWAEISAVPVRNNVGEVTGYIGTAVDLTEHKLWEDELKRANKQVTDVLESITEMFIALDYDWRFTYVNRPTVERARKPLEEILGRNIWELYPVLTDSNLRTQLERVMTDRLTAHFEFPAPHGLWFDVHAYPSNGGLSAYFLDVTERKKNEEEHSRLAAIIDASNDAIMSLALDGSVLTWNAGAEKVYGYSAQEMIGRKITVLQPDQVQETEQRLERLKHGESIQNFDTGRLRKDGRQIWISFTASPIRDRHGEVVAISTIARDITEIKALEDRLRQSAKLESLGVLAGGIAHDFNNLLVGILGNASLLRDRLPSTIEARALLDGVISASEGAAVLTRQLLAYSGKGKFVIEPLDVSDLVRDMTKLVEASIPKSVVLRDHLASDLPPVVADVAQLQQLIMNLVINGAEAIGDRSGFVTVTTGERQLSDADACGATVGPDSVRPGRYVFFEVEDTGAGMDQATMARIFDPFFTTKFTGRGLGLSAALGIVRGHQGFIQVTSSPGHGSTFRVLLPAAGEKTASRQPVAEAKDDLRGSGVVLLVDDEDLVRRAAAAMLQYVGYTVLEAADGQQAIELLQSHLDDIQVVILDMSMPVMSGEECLRRMKSIKPELPILLSSGFSETEAVRRFQSAGIATFLQKPYTARRLAELVKNAVRNSGGTWKRAA